MKALSCCKIIHLSNHPIRGVKTISYEEGRLKAHLKGAIVVCYRRFLSHNQVQIAQKVASEVRYA